MSHDPSSPIADPVAVPVGWRVLDRVYCICLSDRKDRYAHAVAEFERVGLGQIVEFKFVERHPTDSEQGIYESHMACLRAGLAAGARTICVFEDDVLFQKYPAERLQHALDFLRTDEWDLFFFGCFVKSSRVTAYPSVLKIQFQCLTHAYVVNRSFAQRLVEIPWNGVAFDDMLRNVEGRYFTVYPGIAVQDGSPSDNDKTQTIDRTRRLLGGSRRLQRWNEFSRRRLKELIIGHLIFIVLMIAVVVFWRR